MGLRFVIGRAGTGKTHLCAGEIVQHMRAAALGENLLWIVPEQATFMTERLLLATGARTPPHHPGQAIGYGSFRTQVLSFNRLAMLMGRELGLAAGRPMEDLARRVLVEEILRERKNDLQLFSSVANRPGFVTRLDATLRELRQHQHTGESLRTLAGDERIAGDTVMSRKLHDLALLLDAYSLACTNQKAFDAEMLMHAVALRAGETTLIAGDSRTKPAIVWVDGLSALTVLEQRLLIALAQHAQRTTVTLLADPDSEVLRAMRAPAPEFDEGLNVFARPERLLLRLVDEAVQRKIRLEPTVMLRQQRRLDHEELVLLEQHLSRVQKVAPASAPESPPPCDRTTVCIWECSDPETEVRAAAQWIRARVTGGDSALRFRDIGVILPQIDAYEDAVRRIFSQHKIPHFIDQRKSVAHHPAVELLRSAVAIVAEGNTGWSRDDVFVYLKTGLARVNVADTALIENYVLQHGMDHANWAAPWQWVAQNRRTDDDEIEISSDEARLLAHINSIRQRVWNDLREWAIGATSPADAHAESGTRFVTLLRELLQRLDVEGQIMALAEEAQRSADVGTQELAQVHLQAWRGVQDVLDLLAGLLIGRPRTLAEFSQLLNTALEGLTLGLIPPTVDQVLISSVARSRVPELQAALILGAVEGAFPRVISEDPILTDSQRELLNELGAENIGIGTDRQLLEERFFDYMAMTRARKHLVLSYPLADRSGKALRKSQYVARTVQLLGDRAGRESFDAARLWQVDQLNTLDDLMSGVVTWVREEIRRRRAQTLLDDPSSSPGGSAQSMQAAYNWVVSAKESDIAAARDLVWDSVRDPVPPELSPDVVARLYPPNRDLRLSISQLEKFAGCPLQYFLHYSLGLREREELELDTLKLGIFFHRVLERVFTLVLRRQLPWPDCTEQQLRAAVSTEVDATGNEIHAELAEQTPGYALMQARAKRTLGIVLETERRRAQAGRMRPVGVEVEFGGRPRPGEKPPGSLVSLPVLRIQTPSGKNVALNGKIDRVDSDGRWATVLDYKSASEKKLQWPSVHAGLMLQLPTYALVIEELAGLQAAAALYLMLGLRRESVPSASAAADPGTDPFYQKLKPFGVINAHAIGALDPDMQGGSSAWYRFKTKKDGGINATSDALPGDEFRALLRFVRAKLAELAESLAAGTITPKPYQDGVTVACDMCDFAPLCPFDRARGQYLILPDLSKKDFITRITADPRAPAASGEGGTP